MTEQKTAEQSQKDIRALVAYRLLDICRERDLTLSMLALKSDVPLTTIKNILNGASQNPGVVTVSKLCDGLGIGLGEFFAADFFKK